VLDRPDEEALPWTGNSGYVQDLWSKGIISEKWGFDPAPENTHVFLCGNPLMIEASLEILGNMGFSEHSKKTPGEIHLEKFW